MYNKITLIGRAGQEAESKTSQNGSLFGSFTLATSERYKQGEEIKERTEWHAVKVFGNIAKVLDYIHKGTLVFVQGPMRYERWENKGQQRISAVVYADTVKLLETKQSTQEEATEVVKEQQLLQTNDLPF